MAKEEKQLRRAANAAQFSDFKKQQLGAVLTYKNKVLAVGWNSTKTHPLQKEYNKLRFEEDNTPHSLHAEMSAILSARHLDVDWTECTMYVSRQLKSGKSGMARPCPSCMAALKKLGIPKIVYTTYDGYAVEHIKKEAV